MVVTLFTAVGTASDVLELSKVSWKLAISLSQLDQETKAVDSTIKNLADEVKSLSNECDLVYAELEEIVNKSETESLPPFDVDDKTWNCLAMQVEETRRTMQELELFVKSVKGEEPSLIGHAQGQMKLDKREDQITSIRTKVCRHTDNLRTTLLLLNTLLAYIAPRQANPELVKELDKLQNTVEKLHRSSKGNPQSRLSHIEATLLQCAREVVVKGMTMYKACLPAESVAGSQGAANSSNIRVAEWVSTLESIRQEQRRSYPSDMVSNVTSVFSRDEAHTVIASTTSTYSPVHKLEAAEVVGEDSDDDLDTDLAKAALDTGAKAFEVQEWEEANSLLQEALQLLQQLPKQQRAFCDIFGLQYKLAVCAYHIMEEPADAEEALMSLIQQSASSDEQRGYIYDAAHLLSLLYIRMDQVDRARSECEKALQARRRLLGKQSDASLESTALMAHIYVLLNNRARAKSYLAMIPEARKDAVIKTVEESLRTKVEYLDSPSLVTLSIFEGSDPVTSRIQNRLSASSLAPPMETRYDNPVSAIIPQSSATSLRQSYQLIPSNKIEVTDRQPATVTSPSSIEERSELRAIQEERANGRYYADVQALSAVATSLDKPLEVNEALKTKTLSRSEILARIGCQPKDRIEEAVCDCDHSAFASLLSKKKDFWRSKMRKRGRPERITALHFAALFGEIDMARRLLNSNFNINEVPYGYSTSLTPLKFAIGARQVDMVEFLITNGARPSEPDSWSTLAGQLMNRSWLRKTMSEAEKEYVPSRMIAIFRILLKHGWDVNAAFETSGGTVLHQAVAFWTDSLWDLDLRVTMSSFLCEQGADPFKANTEGKTPYDMALDSNHRKLLLVLNKGLKKTELDAGLPEPAELSS
ncbi:hypothetical protein EG329_002574 [Mollisiaceae sp. DMI_Dod_QoI]|nr:hypothetical protein EG329_002574 [Helotiales sp. DMI_Dod_QoI]